MDLLTHVLFEFLQGHVFWLHLVGGLACALLLLTQEPLKDLLVGVGAPLLVRHIVGMGGLLVQLSEGVGSLLEGVLQVLEVRVGACLALLHFEEGLLVEFG